VKKLQIMNNESQTTKVYYSIKEVAAQIGESESTLRYWEESFPDMINPARNERGGRSYKESDIEDVRMIQHFIRDRGLTLDGVRKKLKNNKDFAIKQASVVLRLKNIKTELKSLNDALNEVEKRRKLVISN
jgi:DNA-binding transcriptional MerR regulator